MCAHSKTSFLSVFTSLQVFYKFTSFLQAYKCFTSLQVFYKLTSFLTSLQVFLQVYKFHKGWLNLFWGCGTCLRIYAFLSASMRRSGLTQRRRRHFILQRAALGLTALSKMTSSITTFRITTLRKSIKCYLDECCNAEYCYAECCYA
jgi:hypothetical protein